MAVAESWEQWPAEILAARTDPRVIAALAHLFSRNRHGSPGTAPGALAAEALERLLHPDMAAVADVGGLRLHLALASDLRPGGAVIYAMGWDEDAEVWRPVGEVPLGPPPASGEQSIEEPAE